ncbi:hypothetical protein Sme01_02180 [Sphaerisporangium melleum]|uniref:DUF302 domain-containing protein n=1 Tax=Sphaerisporangium melleum TaxID=321316 RepID=A0A917R4K4_9ACTN|nr:DUF302 domain-containing protein [Sphaerisporangium melleum]GGK88933.1 hypothetical protein GCM10007964_34510 [Sphaerisporangium melleum]GII67742.1 hypothetical protein Sme01_02180 [Sphaerisporangium melleum]
MTTFTLSQTIRRIDVTLPQPYERAVQRFEELVPDADLASYGRLDYWPAILQHAKVNAPHGFMNYWKSDMAALMAPASRTPWKCSTYLTGNHTIAERMFRHDPAVMLHAPLRIVIYAGTDDVTHLTVVQPSTLFAGYGDPDITEIGRELDTLLARLLTTLGAQSPPELQP